jgi:hypothetical protein
MIQIVLKIESLGRELQEVDPKLHPFAIVLTQDCDLEQDFRARSANNRPDKLVPNILFCEAIEADRFRGTEGIDRRILDRIRINKDERYQFLQTAAAHEDALREGLPELGIDFKRYFTIPTDEVYRRIELGEAQRRCILSSPYLEHFSSRFAYFLSRIALPSDHASA